MVRRRGRGGRLNYVPLDAFASLPWEGPVKLIYKATLKELPSADPALAYITALSAVAHLTPVTIEGVSGNMLKPTIWIGIVGPAGTGKTSVPQKIFTKLGKRLEGVVSFGVARTRSSVEGIAKQLANGVAVVQIADEVHQILSKRGALSYLADIVDFWKTASTRTIGTMYRRSDAKSMTIPEDAKLTVIWSTTEEDLDAVASALTPAFLRRFIIVKVTAEVDPWKRSEDASELWDLAAEYIKFLNEFRWRGIITVSEEAVKVRDKIIDALILGETDIKRIAKLYISELASKISLIMALERLVHTFNTLYKRKLSSQVYVFGNYSEALKAALNYAVDLTDNGANLVDLLKETDGLLYTHTNTQKEAETDNESRMYVDMCRHLVEDLLKFVENLVSTAHLAGDFKGLSSLSESLTHFIEKISNTPFPPPRFELDGDTVKVYVGDPYILLGIVFATFSLLMAGDIYEISGMHEKWAYFVRRLRELSERFDVVDMRVLSQYMRKFGGYSELWDYVQRAVACGLLQLTEDSSPEHPKFYIVKVIPSAGEGSRE